jgi:hypothetical protein
MAKRPLAELLTTAEAHGELWALIVRHADGRLEIHKTDTFKAELDPARLTDAILDLKKNFNLVDPEPVPCTEALGADVELLNDCAVCSRRQDTT